MTENKKRFLAICTALFFAFFIAGVIISSRKPEVEEGLVYPKGTMSDSLFDSQNMKYKQVKELSDTYAFSHIPYTVDTYPTDGAIVDTGCIFPVSDNFRFYFSEIEKNVGDEEYFFHTIKKQYGTGVLYGYDPELSYVEDIYVQNGFLNGFSGSYTITKFVMDDSTTQKVEYLFGYYLSVPNYDYNMLIAVGTNLEDSKAFDNAKKLLDQLVYTVKFDTAIERRLLDEASAIEKAAEISNANNSEETGETSSAYTSTEIANSGTNNTQTKVEVHNQTTSSSTYTTVTVGDSQKVGMDALGEFYGQNYSTFVTSTQDDMICNVYWEGENVQDIELVCTPTDTVYQTDKIVDGVAQFFVGPLVDGEILIYVLADSTTSITAEMVNNTTGEVTPLNLITISHH